MATYFPKSGPNDLGPLLGVFKAVAGLVPALLYALSVMRPPDSPNKNPPQQKNRIDLYA